jgi:excisionase family DNA binding protein
VSKLAVDMPELWEVGDVAKYFGVSKRTAERMNIPYAKIGRKRKYLKEDVVAYIREKVA